MKRIAPALVCGALIVRLAVAQDPFEAAVRSGDGAAAFAAGADALRAACASPPAGVAADDAALLLLRVAPYGEATPGAWLTVLDGLKVSGPLAALVESERRESLVLLGRRDEAIASARTFGAFEGFLVAGPFDNERGAGMRAELGPEKGPVDPAAVFDGKDRKVGWRPVSAPPTTGAWDLGNFVTPREQALVYLATTLHHPRGARVRLVVGATGAYAVRLNGREVHRRSSRREFSYEQDFVTLELGAGVNELVVKAGVEQGQFFAALRLAGADGGAADPEAKASFDAASFGRPYPAAASRPADAADATVAEPLGFGERAAAAAAREDADAATLLRAVQLLLALRLDDVAKPATPDLTARLLKLLPDDVRARELRARSLRRVVRIAAERADNPRLAALEAVLEKEPRHVPVLLEIARTAFDELHQPAEAARRVAQALAIAPRSAAALQLRSRILDAEGRTAESDRDLAAAAEIGGHAEKFAWARRLQQRGRSADAARALKEAEGLAPGHRGVVEMRGQRAAAAGDLDAALRAAEDLVAAATTDAQARLRLATVHAARQDFAAALAACEAALVYDPDRVEVLSRAALEADRLDRRDAALDYVRRALVVQPGDANLRRYEGRLAGAEQAFEDHYPADVAAVVAAAPDPTVNPQNRPQRVLLARRIVKANAEGTLSDYHQTVVQILSQQGAEAWDAAYVGFRGGEERARIKSARLYRAGAAPVEVERVGSFGADFPTLRVGDVVEWAYRVDDLRPSFFGNYVGVVHSFQGDDLAETLRSELTLLLPKSRTFRFHVRHTDVAPETVAPPPFLADYEARRYVVERLPAVATEPAMPPTAEFVPEVQVSSYPDWNAFAGWWWNLIDEQRDVSDAMRAKVRELTAGKSTDEEKLRALYAFVVTDVRYVAWEFGVHGYKPYRTSAVFERRFGDCKDKALLLSALCKEAGIKAYPVLIRLEDARFAEDQSLALVEHFNHCIAAVDDGAGGFRFFDGTAEFHAPDELPDGDRGARVVVVKDGAAVNAQVPFARPDDNADRESLRVELKADGSATFSSEIALKGRDAVAARATYVNESDRRDVLSRELGGRLGAGTLGAFETSKLDDLGAPVTLKWTFETKDALVRDGGKSRLRPFWPEFDWTTLVAAPERRFDLLLGQPFRTETVATVVLPPGFAVADAQRPTEIETPFAYYSLVRETGAGTLTLRRTLELRAPRVSAKDYAAFKAFVTQVAAADAATATLEETR